ncbi:Uncharacterised protein [uncultured archaeon]|nr:Uncharacterised protein [uncultured archaeon]
MVNKKNRTLVGISVLLVLAVIASVVVYSNQTNVSGNAIFQFKKINSQAVISLEQNGVYNLTTWVENPKGSCYGKSDSIKFDFCFSYMYKPNMTCGKQYRIKGSPTLYEIEEVQHYYLTYVNHFNPHEYIMEGCVGDRTNPNDLRFYSYCTSQAEAPWSTFDWNYTAPSTGSYLLKFNIEAYEQLVDKPVRGVDQRDTTKTIDVVLSSNQCSCMSPTLAILKNATLVKA